MTHKTKTLTPDTDLYLDTRPPGSTVDTPHDQVWLIMAINEEPLAMAPAASAIEEYVENAEEFGDDTEEGLQRVAALRAFAEKATAAADRLQKYFTEVHADEGSDA